MVSHGTPLQSRGSQTPRVRLAELTCLLIASVLLCAIYGCGEPLQAVEVLVDEGWDVHQTELVWIDDEGWVRFVTISNPVCVQITRQSGEVITYHGRRLTSD